MEFYPEEKGPGSQGHMVNQRCLARSQPGVTGHPHPTGSSVLPVRVAARAPDVGQGEAEFLSPVTWHQDGLLLCAAGLSLRQESRAETLGNLVLIRVIKSCPAASTAFVLNLGS